MSVTGLPFDDFRTLIRDLPGHDVAALAAARSRIRIVMQRPHPRQHVLRLAHVRLKPLPE